MTAQPSLFEPEPVEPRPAVVRFVEGAYTAWFELRLGRKPRKTEKTDIAATARRVSEEFERLVQRVADDEGRK